VLAAPAAAQRPSGASGALVIKLLADEGGAVTVTSGGLARTVALLDDGVSPDPVAGDGLWCGAAPLRDDGEVQITRSLGGATWTGTFQPSGAKPELVLRLDAGGALLEATLDATGASPDLAVSPWSDLPSHRPPYGRLLLLAGACLAVGAVIRRLR